MLRKIKVFLIGFFYSILAFCGLYFAYISVSNMITDGWSMRMTVVCLVAGVNSLITCYDIGKALLVEKEK